MGLRVKIKLYKKKKNFEKLYSWPRPGNSAILLETGSIDHNRALSEITPALLRITEKKFPLILVRGSQSYLSWYIVSLHLAASSSKNVKTLRLKNIVKYYLKLIFHAIIEKNSRA